MMLTRNRRKPRLTYGISALVPLMLILLAGCAEHALLLGNGLCEGGARSINLSLIKREHPEFHGRFEKAVKIVDDFIKERAYFKSGFEVEKPSLTIRNDRLYFNGEELLLARGSLILTLGALTGIITRMTPRASTSPGRISFRIFGSEEESDLMNGLFFDKHNKRKFIQKSSELRMATILCHELAHVVQFRRDGAAYYYTAYTINFMFNIFNPLTYFGKNPGPYRRIGYEAEARKYEKALYLECKEKFERSLEGKPDAP
ncbi:MAG: hypothetical protein ACYS8W_11260 [Planctomycetota bacterium]|jgi:hypothetical protein